MGKRASAYFISAYLYANIQFYLICTFTYFHVSAVPKCFDKLESTFIPWGTLTFHSNTKTQTWTWQFPIKEK